MTCGMVYKLRCSAILYINGVNTWLLNAVKIKYMHTKAQNLPNGVHSEMTSYFPQFCFGALQQAPQETLRKNSLFWWTFNSPDLSSRFLAYDFVNFCLFAAVFYLNAWSWPESLASLHSYDFDFPLNYAIFGSLG